MINQYEHILPLSEVKQYLRLDDDFTEDDNQVNRMINAAFGFIEKKTNYIFRPNDKTYYSNSSGNIDVFDYPINTDVSGYNIQIKPLFTRFCSIDSITLNVGFETVNDAPIALIECALQMIKVFYYEAEKNVNTTLLPEAVNEIISSHRRFIIC